MALSVSVHLDSRFSDAEFTFRHSVSDAGHLHAVVELEPAQSGGANVNMFAADPATLRALASTLATAALELEAKQSAAGEPYRKVFRAV